MERIKRGRKHIYVLFLMTLKTRYLTKSLFALACECPTKLYYTNKRDEYPNTKLEDPFLKALSEGGLQVAALAKQYYPEGKEIETLDYEQALAETNNYLQEEKIVIFEAAIKHQNLFVRADLLIKDGNYIELIEVKAKSYDSNKPQNFLTKKGDVSAKWYPYIQDIAFQMYVFQQAFPHFSIKPYLLLADKRAICPTNGLNQKFLLKQGGSNRKVMVVNTSSLTQEESSQKILTKVSVEEAIQAIFKNKDKNSGKTFQQNVEQFSTAYKDDRRIWSAINKECANCEFKLTIEEEEHGLKSGFQECWTNHLGWEKTDFNEPTVLELWNYRKKDELIARGICKLSDVTKDMLGVKQDGKPGMSTSERQMHQVLKVKTKDNEPEIDLKGLQAEIEKLTFPLHFIDFETIQPAIPFHKGRCPYEGIAFQFSHHQMELDGTVSHKGEYLNTKTFPNYEFVRQLKNQLTQDRGSIFRYSNHENTYLNYIYTQLEEDPNSPDDVQELQDFIKNISKSSSERKKENSWEGERNMIDLLEWVKRYYYDPRTNGSNSIKHVLPTLLNSSSYLQERYSQPNYGKFNDIKGSNFEDFQWVQYENNVVKDPYKLLPSLFTNVSEKDHILLTQKNEINNGSAALTAYAKIQSTELNIEERTALKAGLLRYSELDTLAMVMIFEGWRNWK